MIPYINSSWKSSMVANAAAFDDVGCGVGRVMTMGAGARKDLARREVSWTVSSANHADLFLFACPCGPTQAQLPPTFIQPFGLATFTPCSPPVQVIPHDQSLLLSPAGFLLVSGQKGIKHSKLSLKLIPIF